MGEFYRAVNGHNVDEEEDLAIKGVLRHATTEELIQAAQEGACSMRGLVTIMHAAFGQFGHEEDRIRTINGYRLPGWEHLVATCFEPGAETGNVTPEPLRIH